MSKLVDFVFHTHDVRGDIDFAPKFKGDMSGVSMTRQEFADECDINTIMARYDAGGGFSHVNRAEPRYMDFTNVPDLQGSLDFVREASIAFNSLPALVRKEFDNDPVKYVEFAQEPKNIERMREWGLAAPAAVEPAPISVTIKGGRLDPSGDGVAAVAGGPKV